MTGVLAVLAAFSPARTAKGNYQMVAIAWPHGESDILAAAMRQRKPKIMTDIPMVSTLIVLGRIIAESPRMGAHSFAGGMVESATERGIVY